MSAPDAAAAGRPEAPPTCYRHTERETYIRCVRCERPICPDCMTPASVGFMCPDDLREGAASVRQPRTRFGGRVGDDPGYVSKVLIALNIAMFVLQQAVPGLERRLLLVGGVIDPFSGQPLLEGVASGQWWRLVTAAFLHGSLLHIAFNMYAVWLFGPPLEQAFGRVRFAALYLTAALGGTTASYAVNQPNTASLGASGAVFGLFAAYLVLARKLRLDLSGLLVLLGLNVVLGFLLPNIDWRAHAGGFVAGGVVALVVVNAPKGLRRLLHPLVVALVVLVALGGVVARTAQLTGASPATVTRCVVTSPVTQDTFPGCVRPRLSPGA